MTSLRSESSASGSSSALPREPGHDERSVGELVKSVSTQISALIHAEIELAKTELKVDLKAAAAGAGAVAVAALFGLFLLVMLLIALAEGIVALGLPRWSAYLIVAGLLLVLAAIVGLVGLAAFKKIRAPRKTIDSAKDTVSMVTSRPHDPATARSTSSTDPAPGLPAATPTER